MGIFHSYVSLPEGKWDLLKNSSWCTENANLSYAKRAKSTGRPFFRMVFQWKCTKSADTHTNTHTNTQTQTHKHKHKHTHKHTHTQTQHTHTTHTHTTHTHTYTYLYIYIYTYMFPYDYFSWPCWTAVRKHGCFPYCISTKQELVCNDPRNQWRTLMATEAIAMGNWSDLPRRGTLGN